MLDTYESLNGPLVDKIAEYPSTYSLLVEKGMKSVISLESTWRKENLLIHVVCENEQYVLKILGVDEDNELGRLRLLSGTYSDLYPNVINEERNAYLMMYIVGKHFFDLPVGERVEKVNQLGEVLASKWRLGDYPSLDIREGVQRLFDRYRRSRAEFFDDGELTNVDFSLFEKVPDRPSHNDLNCANAIFGEGVKLIDPSEEGYNDVARDVGRFLASVFFNNYDRFGNDRVKSLDIAEAFLAHFNDDLVARARFFAGESFLSFLRFDTVSTPKSVLKQLATRTLSPGGSLLQCLEECI